MNKRYIEHLQTSIVYVVSDSPKLIFCLPRPHSSGRRPPMTTEKALQELYNRFKCSKISSPVEFRTIILKA